MSYAVLPKYLTGDEKKRWINTKILSIFQHKIKVDQFESSIFVGIFQ
jgi:hypothetical protein